ncbi:MAG: cyclopropane-fatty-acyl-phospholipid synthase family protein [Chloroflexota bacterium]
MTTEAKTSDSTIAWSLTFLRNLFKGYHPRNFAVRLWDGTVWPAETGSPRFTLALKHPGALHQILRETGSDLSIGESYTYDDFDIEGDLEAVFPVADYLAGLERGLINELRLGWDLLHLPTASGLPRQGRQAAQVSGEIHSLERDRQAVTYHYDVSNDFFALWLDRNMVYSCAYFVRPNDDLDTAQANKLDYICTKLRLRAGERLLDIGCGWGGLVIHAVRQYGVEAVGITLSQPQADLANERIHQARLADRCRVEVLDYRQLDEPANFDKLASVGMIEHVGEAKLPEYFRQAWRMLRPGGVFLNHGIARRAVDPVVQGPTFSNRYVFPDGELTPLNVILRYAEAADFEIRDVESLREHYALTLRHWVRRLEAKQQEVLQIVDEPTYRIWRLFMSASAHSFSVGRLNVYQVLLAKPDYSHSGLPLTRDDWYN